MRINELAVVVLLVMIVLVYIKIKRGDLVYTKSDIDSKQYLVRDVADKKKAANLLARLKGNIETIVYYLNKNIGKYKGYESYIRQLTSRIKSTDILESPSGSSYTSYSVNKGEQIVFCLRSKKFDGRIHDLNLIMYVMLHEISHVACPEYGHTQLFRKIFKFIAEVAVELGLYTKIEFNIDPKEYCGLTISDSII